MKEIIAFEDISEFKDSWGLDLDELEEELNTLRRKVALVKRERKLQPRLMMRSELTDDYVVVNRFHLHKVDKDRIFIMAESKRDATEAEIQEFLDRKK